MEVHQKGQGFNENSQRLKECHQPCRFHLEFHNFYVRTEEEQPTTFPTAAFLRILVRIEPQQKMARKVFARLSQLQGHHRDRRTSHHGLPDLPRHSRGDQNERQTDLDEENTLPLKSATLVHKRGNEQPTFPRLESILRSHRSTTKGTHRATTRQRTHREEGPTQDPPDAQRRIVQGSCDIIPHRAKTLGPLQQSRLPGRERRDNRSMTTTLYKSA